MKLWPLLLTLMSALLLCACSKDDNDTSEYHDWQVRNDTYFANLRLQAHDSIQQAKTLYGNEWQEKGNWRAYLDYALQEDASNQSTDTVYVQVLKRGTGSGSPFSSDSCRIFFRGRLIPSDSYPEGYVFSHSGQSSIYSDIFNRSIAVPSLRTASSYVKGLTTALLHMHIGDRWRLYVPYELSYKTVAYGTVPAYSDLIFEVELVAYYRNGSEVPTWN